MQPSLFEATPIRDEALHRIQQHKGFWGLQVLVDSIRVVHAPHLRGHRQALEYALQHHLPEVVGTMKRHVRSFPEDSAVLDLAEYLETHQEVFK